MAILCFCLFVSRHTRDLYEQETRLSQRDRAMLRVTEYFAKTLKVTQGHSTLGRDGRVISVTGL